MHCNYPLGAQLLRELDMLIGSSLLDNLPEPWSRNYASQFLLKLRRCGLYSIDSFLENTDEQEVLLGKYLLAYSLKKFEVVDRLFTLNNPNWYQYLFNSLISVNNDSLSENNLSIVTFNYDRSLEAYLYNACLNGFSLSHELAMKELEEIPIFHVHGILGGFDEYPYKPECTQDDLLKISESIKIIHEIQDSETDFCNLSFRHANYVIGRVEKVYFLGFGFHDDNVRRLSVDWSKKGYGKVFATLPDATDVEYHQLIKRLEPFGFTSMIMPQYEHTCENIFRHVSPLE